MPFTHWLQTRPSVLRDETARGKIPQNPIFICLIFLAVFAVTQLTVSVVPSLLIVPEQMFYLLKADIDLASYSAVIEYVSSFHMSDGAFASQLYSTALATFLTLVYCLELERRSLRSLGFVRKNAVRDYLLGVLLGAAMLGGAVAFGVATGSMHFDHAGTDGKTALLLVLLGGWLLQGMSEEVLFRGFFCNTLARRVNRHLAALISAAGFMLAHLANPGITLLACVNLLLFGLFAAYFMFRFDSLWGICAVHSLWNFSQGNLFGVQVSGLDVSASLLHFNVDSAATLLNGGSFGLEGGLGVTLVLTAGIALLLFVPEKQRADVSSP